MEHKEVEILFIEDSKSDAELTLRTLKKSNLANNIIHLKDGASAIDFLFCKGAFAKRDFNNKPKVILLDLKLPKLNGLEVLKKIKENKLTKEIPVVVLTSSKEHPDVEKAYALGANSYIVKPVDFTGFKNAISSLGFYWMLFNYQNE